MGAIISETKISNINKISVTKNSEEKTLKIIIEDQCSIILSYEESAILFKKIHDKLKEALYETYMC